MPSTLPGALALFAGFAAVIAIILFYVTSWNKFRVELELRHAGIWKSLGSPGFTRRNWGERDMLSGFLLMRRYRQVGDAELTKLGDRALLSLGIALLCWLAFGIYLFGFASHR